MATLPTLPVLRFKNDGPKRNLLWVDGAMAHVPKPVL